MTSFLQQDRNRAILKTVKVMPARAEWIAAEATRETLYIRCGASDSGVKLSAFPLLISCRPTGRAVYPMALLAAVLGALLYIKVRPARALCGNGASAGSVIHAAKSFIGIF